MEKKSNIEKNMVNSGIWDARMQLNTLFDIVKKKVIQTSFIYLSLQSKIWNIILYYYIIYVILETLYWIQQLQFKRCKMNSKY